jgi:hypothetical protein
MMLDYLDTKYGLVGLKFCYLGFPATITDLTFDKEFRVTARVHTGIGDGVTIFPKFEHVTMMKGKIS